MRIPPLDEDEWDDEVAAAVLMLRPPRGDSPTADKPWDPRLMPANTWAPVVARHAGLVAAWSPLTAYLLTKGALPARQRELAILRVAWACQSPYQWRTHVVMAPAFGVQPADVERVRGGPDAPEWSAHDRAVLRAVDQLMASATIDDETWAALAEVWDERQLVELPVLVGQYLMIAFCHNAIGVDVPDWDAPTA